MKRLGTDYIDLYYQDRVDPKTPIPGTRSTERLEENWRSQDVVLSREHWQRLDASIKSGVTGARY